MSDKLSIIVPVYNSYAYINSLIASIVNQTYKNIELILIDDGSTDNSGSLCDGWAAQDQRIKVIHKENGGQSSARNKGLDIATGDFIAFADNDDILHPQMYETMLYELNYYECSVCACNFLNVPQKEMENIICASPEAAKWVDEQDLIRDFFQPTWRIPIWNKVYRREILEDVRFHNVHLGEDNRFSYNVIRKCKGMPYIRTPMYFQRMHGANFEFTGTEYLNELLQVKEEILKDIKITYPYEYSNAYKQFVYECIRTFNQFTENDKEIARQESMEILLRNISGDLLKLLPKGHKLLMFLLKLTKGKYIHGKIVI